MNLNQVTLPASDITVSTSFYLGLGLKLIVDSPDYVRFECPEGGSTLSLHRSPAAGTNSGVVVYFELRNLDASVDDLISRGYAFDQMPTDERWLWREARLRDPDNNVICLFYAGDNRKNPPWRIDT